MFGIFKNKLEPVVQPKSDSVEFAIWLQDSYSQNKKQGRTEMLPTGFMREDFTNNIYPIEDLYFKFLNE